MQSQIIRNSSRKEVTVYSLFFQKKGMSVGAGRRFDCNKKGVVIEASKEWAEETIASGEFEAGEIQSEIIVKKTPAILQCSCGNKMPLSGGYDTSCEKCGVEYNGFGQQLAPRSQWIEGGDY